MVMGETSFVRLDNYPDPSKATSAATCQTMCSDGFQVAITKPLASLREQRNLGRITQLRTDISGGVADVVPGEVGRGEDGEQGWSSLLLPPTVPHHSHCEWLPPNTVIQ
jgi:hypothetical protein